jgi:hypothetical protein
VVVPPEFGFGAGTATQAQQGEQHAGAAGWTGGWLSKVGEIFVSCRIGQWRGCAGYLRTWDTAVHPPSLEDEVMPLSQHPLVSEYMFGFLVQLAVYSHAVLQPRV